MPLRGWTLAAAFSLLIVVGCSPSIEEPRRLVEFADPVAVAVMGSGDNRSVFVGSRSTGEIVRIELDGAPPADATLVARLAVSTEGQRGLLDLVATDDGRLVVSWTDRDLTLRIDQVDLDDGSTTPIWAGPQSSSGANGGRLVDVDGGILIGVGTLRRGALVSDPGAANGKLLLVDPAGPADQTPTVVSAGWNNPFALAVDADGRLWVADNDPGDELERLALGNDLGGQPVVVADLPIDTAPAGMAVLDDGRLVICSFLTGDLLVYSKPAQEIAAGSSLQKTVPVGCKLGVVAAGGNQVLVSTESEVILLDLGA